MSIHETPTKTETNTATKTLWSHFTAGEHVQYYLRDQLRSAIPNNWTEELYPHITILPGYTVPESVADEAAALTEHIGAAHVGTEVPVDDVYCFHPLNSNNPTFVVAIEIGMNLNGIRHRQAAQLTNFSGEPTLEPKRPHITLFKSGDSGENHDPLTPTQRENIRTAIDSLTVPDTIHISDMHVEECTY